MSDLKGRQLQNSYQDVLTKGSGATPIEDGDGNAFFYEEGTWTPVDASGAGLTFSITNGGFARNGNEVSLHARITYPSTADGNAAKIGGLPFTISVDLFKRGIPTIVSNASKIVTGAGIINTDQIDLFEAGSLSSTSMLNSDLSGATLYLSMVIIID